MSLAPGEIVGRAAEIAALRAFLSRPAPAALVIEGEAGCGKTTVWEAGLEGGGRVRGAPAAQRDGSPAPDAAGRRGLVVARARRHPGGPAPRDRTARRGRRRRRARLPAPQSARAAARGGDPRPLGRQPLLRAGAGARARARPASRGRRGPSLAAVAARARPRPARRAARRRGGGGG